MLNEEESRMTAKRQEMTTVEESALRQVEERSQMEMIEAQSAVAARELPHEDEERGIIGIQVHIGEGETNSSQREGAFCHRGTECVARKCLST
jgi:hypothetical protein